MNNLNTKNLLIASILFLTLSFLPNTVKAMGISVEPAASVHSGDTVIFNVLINTDKQEINVTEGSLTIVGNYVVTAINTSGSLFTLWPNKPSLTGKKISFTGGATSGVSGSQLKLFSIALKPTTTGSLNFSFADVSAYKNDGVATKVVVTGLPSSIKVDTARPAPEDGLAKIIIADKIPPNDFEIVIGKDAQTFDGKYFASFVTTDDQSGINRYEVLEGNGSPVRSGTPYVLQNQELSEDITVHAIDNAGNTKSVTVSMKRAASPQSSWTAKILTTLAILLFILVVSIVIRNYKKKWQRKNI